MEAPTVQITDLTLGQVQPYLSERGGIELEAAVARLSAANAQQIIAERDARIAELEAAAGEVEACPTPT